MAWGRLRAVVAREYLERVRTRWFLVATVFGPLLFGALLFVPPWLAANSQASTDLARIAILDATGTTLGTRVAAQLNGGLTGDTSLTIVRAVAPARLPAAESTATREAVANRTRGYLVLDSATLAGRTVRYVGANATSSPDMDRLQRIVRDAVVALRLERAGLNSLESNAIATMRLRLDPERITERGQGGSARVSIYFAFTVALLLYVSILLYGQSVLRGVIEEKQTRVAEVVVASVSPDILLAGKVLGIGAVGLTQMAIWTATSVALAKVRTPILARFGLPAMPGSFPDISLGMGALVLVFFGLGYLFYAALFAAVGATVSNEHDAQQAQMPITLLLVGTVIFLAPILAAPESTLAYVLAWLPFSAPIVVPLRMSVINLPPLDIAVSIVMLASACYLALWFAARVYRVGLLMYGKRVTVREMLHWVRVAR
ncbi:MAG TPA: ABC transporter permease [Gemmatimonadaceae bacterium]|nr:ABC transporter permease [Gemmatimonadaceae bacterium]